MKVYIAKPRNGKGKTIYSFYEIKNNNIISPSKSLDEIVNDLNVDANTLNFALEIVYLFREITKISVLEKSKILRDIYRSINILEENKVGEYLRKELRERFLREVEKTRELVYQEKSFMIFLINNKIFVTYTPFFRLGDFISTIGFEVENYELSRAKIIEINEVEIMKFMDIKEYKRLVELLNRFSEEKFLLRYPYSVGISILAISKVNNISIPLGIDDLNLIVETSEGNFEYEWLYPSSLKMKCTILYEAKKVIYNGKGKIEDILGCGSVPMWFLGWMYAKIDPFLAKIYSEVL